MHTSLFILFKLFYSLLLLADIVTDCLVAAQYFHLKLWYFFIPSLVFLCLAPFISVVLSIFLVKKYGKDSMQNGVMLVLLLFGFPVSVLVFAILIPFALLREAWLHAWSCIRYCDSDAYHFDDGYVYSFAYLHNGVLRFLEDIPEIILIVIFWILHPSHFNSLDLASFIISCVCMVIGMTKFFKRDLKKCTEFIKEVQTSEINAQRGITED